MFLNDCVSRFIIVNSLHQISGVTKWWSRLYTVNGAIKAQFNKSVDYKFLSLLPCVLRWIVTSHKFRFSSDDI